MYKRSQDVAGVRPAARRLRLRSLSGAMLLMLMMLLPVHGGAQAQAQVGVPTWRQLPLNVTWQYQLQGQLDLDLPVAVQGVDLFDTPVSTISSLQVRNKTVICYFSGGTYENWRSDRNRFPSSILGNNLADWPGERWLDVRNFRQTGLGDIMRARLDLAVSKGCNCVDPDNVNAYLNPSGFPLTPAHQLEYNKFLANEAHARNMCIALKNDLTQVAELTPYFDLAINEECTLFNECHYYQPMLDAGKPVLGVSYCEYGATLATCAKVAGKPGMNWIIRGVLLHARPYYACDGSGIGDPAPCLG